MKILIIGGTGLLGYHAALECLRRGHEVHSLAISDIDLGDWFPAEIVVHTVDVFALSPRQLSRQLKGFDALIWAVGPDDRHTPAAPAYDFFHEHLVEACGRVLGAARRAGVRRCTVLGSYYTYFNRLWPDKHLAERHPYIRCRVEQAERAFAEGGDSMCVNLLELPYIFGVMPGREPLWKSLLLDRLLRTPVVLYPQGGSTMISAEHVGQAVAGAIERGKHEVCYPIGDENLSWDEMLGVMLATLGIDKQVHHIPGFIGTLLGRAMRLADARQGKESGLNHELLFADVMTQTLYLDPAASVRALRYGRGGVREAIAATTRACYPERFGAQT